MEPVIFQQLEELARLLTSKGIIAPDVHVTLTSARKISGYLWASNPLPGTTSTGKGWFGHETAAEVLAEMNTWALNLPSIEDANKAIFIRKVADAIDFGNEHGFEISPLQTYHTNLLGAPA